jgi:hypothetical protein
MRPVKLVEKMLLAKGKITQDVIKLLNKWRHSGFNVCVGRVYCLASKFMASGS